MVAISFHFSGIFTNSRKLNLQDKAKQNRKPQQQ